MSSTHLACPVEGCEYLEPVSPEDPDAASTMVYDHLRWLHFPDPWDAQAWLAKAKEAAGMSESSHMDDKGLPQVRNIADARFWIGVLHRRSVGDAKEIDKLKDRVSELERTWLNRLRGRMRDLRERP